MEIGEARPVACRDVRGHVRRCARRDLTGPISRGPGPPVREVPPVNHSQNSTTTPATSGAHVRRLVGTTAAVLTGVALAAAAGTTARATA